jgi:succinate-acetate transporter protein
MEVKMSEPAGREPQPETIPERDAAARGTRTDPAGLSPANAAVQQASRLANPGAWAVTAFATTSFMLGMYNTGLLHSGGATVVIPVAFFYGGLIQIIVGVLEIARGNLFGAVVFGTYGPFWVIYGFIIEFYAGKIPAANVGSAVSLFLAVFAIVTFYFFLASLKTDAVLVIILALIFIGLVLLSIGAGGNYSVITKAGGWVTLLFAVIAWYHAAADMINTNFGRAVLPLWPIAATGRAHR